MRVFNSTVKINGIYLKANNLIVDYNKYRICGDFSVIQEYYNKCLNNSEMFLVDIDCEIGHCLGVNIEIKDDRYDYISSFSIGYLYIYGDTVFIVPEDFQGIWVTYMKLQDTITTIMKYLNDLCLDSESKCDILKCLLSFTRYKYVSLLKNDNYLIGYDDVFFGGKIYVEFNSDVTYFMEYREIASDEHYNHILISKLSEPRDICVLTQDNSIIYLGCTLKSEYGFCEYDYLFKYTIDGDMLYIVGNEVNKVQKFRIKNKIIS